MQEKLKVEVYWNLHRHCWSVRACEGPQKGRVVAHADTVQLTDVTLVVQPAGNAKVRREGRKNVHAFARGRWHLNTVLVLSVTGSLTYNPYKDTTFVMPDNDGIRHPVTRAEYVVMTGDGVRPSVTAAGAS